MRRAIYRAGWFIVRGVYNFFVQDRQSRTVRGKTHCCRRDVRVMEPTLAIAADHDFDGL